MNYLVYIKKFSHVPFILKNSLEQAIPMNPSTHVHKYKGNCEETNHSTYFLEVLQQEASCDQVENKKILDNSMDNYLKIILKALEITAGHSKFKSFFTLFNSRILTLT